MATIKDSGTRRKFETGAVRDMQEGKGRLDLLPWCAIMRVARHFEAGAVKYGDRNWERGIPLSSFMDSAARHIAKYMDGQTDEDHLVAAAWNLLCALWTEEKRPDLINIPTRPEYAGGAQYGLENEDEMITETETNPALYAGMYAAEKKEPKLQEADPLPGTKPNPEGEIDLEPFLETENDQKLKAHYWRTTYKEHLADVIISALPDPDGYSRVLVHDGGDSLLVTKANGWPLSVLEKAAVHDAVNRFISQSEHPGLVPRVMFSEIADDRHPLEGMHLTPQFDKYAERIKRKQYKEE